MSKFCVLNFSKCYIRALILNQALESRYLAYIKHMLLIIKFTAIVVKTTPVTAMQMEVELLPAARRLDLIKEKAAIRFHKLDNTYAII
jgi:hypothetical protein